MAGACASRLPFLVAASLIAAAAGDAVVESISNSGMFGGSYTDNVHLGIGPTLIVGAALVVELLVLRFAAVWQHTTAGSREALVDVARGFGARSFARDVPFVFAMQLAALFVLESVEQLVAGGRFLGGAIWLGGPIAFSLLTHALIGAGCTAALGAVMRAVVRIFVSIVREAIQCIWLALARGVSGTRHVDIRAFACPRAQAPHVRQIGGRAPPLRPIPA